MPVPGRAETEPNQARRGSIKQLLVRARAIKEHQNRCDDKRLAHSGTGAPVVSKATAEDALALKAKIAAEVDEAARKTLSAQLAAMEAALGTPPCCCGAPAAVCRLLLCSAVLCCALLYCCGSGAAPQNGVPCQQSFSL